MLRNEKLSFFMSLTSPFPHFGEGGSSFSTMPAFCCSGDPPSVNVVHTVVLPENSLHASKVIENK